MRIKPNTEIVKLMTPFPYTVDISAQIDEALKMLDEHDIHHLPVTDNEELVGIVSRQAIAYVESLEVEASSITLQQLTIQKPVVVETTETVATVLSRMIANHVQAVLVVKHDRLAGIFTHTDAYTVLLNQITGRDSSFEPPDITA